jgi:hypothetical protein
MMGAAENGKSWNSHCCAAVSFVLMRVLLGMLRHHNTHVSADGLWKGSPAMWF